MPLRRTGLSEGHGTRGGPIPIALTLGLACMTAERTPQIERSVLAWALVVVARLATAYPWLTVSVGILLAAVSIALSATRMGYHTSRTALISNRSEYQQRWLEYTKEFGEKEDVVIVVEGPSRQAIVPVLEDLAARVSHEERYFRSVFHDEIDLRKLRGKGLYYLPLQATQAIDRSLDEITPIFQGDWTLLSPAAMAGAMASGLRAMGNGAGNLPPEQAAAALSTLQKRLGPMCDMLAAALDPAAQHKSPFPEILGPEVFSSQMMSQGLGKPNERFGFVVLKLGEEAAAGMTENPQAIAALRRIVAEAKSRHGEVKIGLTGLPIMEYDEMQSSQSSMVVATILSYLGVFIVLVAGFGGIRHSLLAMAALILGMIWSLGYTTLSIGHLNILSSAFAAILTGLGINYGIYYVAQYLQLRKAGFATPEALVGTAGTVGAGITIGAVGTAVAFFMAGFTEFVGVAELGIVAGGGIVACWLAAMTVLPGALRLSDARRASRILPTPLDFHLWLNPILARPRSFLLASLAFTLFLGLGVPLLRYDYNLLNMQAAGLESVALEQKLLRETDQSAYFALSIAESAPEALARKAEFLKLASVERVEEIASLLPPDMEQKRSIIQRIAGRLRSLPEQPPQIPVSPQDQLLPMLYQLRTVLAAAPQSAATARQLGALADLVGRMPAGEYVARLSGYSQRVAGELLGRLRLLRSVANPEPPQWNDLPDGVVDRFVGRSGKLLLRIYGKGNLWDVDATERFVADVRRVDPKATGNPMQVSESSRIMKQSYEQAAVYALLIILPVVFLDFGSLRDTMLAILPLALGMLQLFGLMGLLNVPLNPANTIALPLMLGMGVDNGVHIMHDFRSQRGRYRMSHSTSVAVVLNTVTTMVGFAVLMIAEHRGLQSLGRMLTLGMAFCLLSSFVILPAILVLMTQNRREARRPEESASAEDDRRAESVSDDAPRYRRDAAHRHEQGPAESSPAKRKIPRPRDPLERVQS